MDRVIFHCDLNCFYASVELLSHPELREVPVAVAGDPASRHGIILAKNEPAKQFGVKTAETIWQAKKKCPNLVLLPAHRRLYHEYSKKVNAIYDEYTDLAVLKISSEHVKDVATFADSSKLTIGEPAIAVGSPLGSQFANTATEGILSATSRQVTLTQENGQTTNINAIQTDAAINPGNSGGALINIEGQVIGITQSKITTTEDGSTSVEGLGFAIPSNDVVNIINKLEADGKISRPALGIRMVDLSQLSTNDSSQLKLPSSVTGGVVVYSVQSGLPAASAGLKAGDVITKVGDTAVTSSTDLQSALYSHNINDTVKVTYYRDGKSNTADVKLSKSTSDLETSSSSSSN